MKVVVDSSVALKWVLSEPGSDRAAILLQDASAEEPRLQLFAPTIWLTELSNAVWRQTRESLITGAIAEDCLNALMAAPVTLMETRDLSVMALRLAVTLSHPVYDCLYLAAAIRLDCPVVTDDRRFKAAADRHPEHAGRVRLL